MIKRELFEIILFQTFLLENEINCKKFWKTKIPQATIRNIVFHQHHHQKKTSEKWIMKRWR